jgi:hypothetical protein
MRNQDPQGAAFLDKKPRLLQLLRDTPTGNLPSSRGDKLVKTRHFGVQPPKAINR